MHLDFDSIEASIHYSSPDNRFHYVKFYFPSLGLYIDSFSVKESPHHSEKGLWVQKPAIPNNGKFIKPIGFTKDSPLWPYLEAKAQEIVEQKCNAGLIDEFTDEQIERDLDEAIKKMSDSPP